MLPVLDPAVLRVLTLSSPDQASAAPMFFAAPVRWVDGEDGDLIALGVGSIDGEPRREKLATLHSHVVQNAFPGISRQNTRNVIEPVASRESSGRLAPATGPPSSAAGGFVPSTMPAPSAGSIPPTGPAPSHPVPPGPSAAQPLPAAGPPAVPSFQPPPVSEANLPATSQPRAMQASPMPLTNGIGNAGPGPISLPPQALPSQLQRSGTEYFTPAVDTSELKRL